MVEGFPFPCLLFSTSTLSTLAPTPSCFLDTNMADEGDRVRRSRKAQKPRRNELRKNLTPAEARLWSYLQGRQLAGRKFRRQHGVGTYILDFFCPEEHLAIELDGEVHEGLIAARLDDERSNFLAAQGIRVIRFENRVIFENAEWVLEQIQGEFSDG